MIPSNADRNKKGVVHVGIETLREQLLFEWAMNVDWMDQAYINKSGWNQVERRE